MISAWKLNASAELSAWHALVNSLSAYGAMPLGRALDVDVGSAANVTQ